MQFYSMGHYGPNDFATFYESLPLMSTLKAAAVCKLLDIKPDTLVKYLTGKSNPPKAMVRLLFHESHFGRQATDTHTHNGFLYKLRENQNLLFEVQMLKKTLAAVELENQELKFSSSNDVLFAANSSKYRA